MRKVISIIGAGGKTTLVHRLAEKYRSQGQTVLVTTTTHMALEAGADLSGSSKSIREKLERAGFCLAGMECGDTRKKMGPLSEPAFTEVIGAADVVLIEADGARHHNIKFPREGEPVIHPATTDIILVMGLAALGKTAGEELFRLPVLQAYQKEHGDLVIREDDPVTMEVIRYLIEEGYEKPLKKQFPQAAFHVCLSYRDEQGILRYRKR